LENQVPLKLILDFVSSNNTPTGNDGIGEWRRVNELPWGSPIYEGKWRGHQLRIAAYTEPSLYWERFNGMARSWNLLSDGTVFASLEDDQSIVCQSNIPIEMEAARSLANIRRAKADRRLRLAAKANANVNANANATTASTRIPTSPISSSSRSAYSRSPITTSSFQ
jgi:hypothetical protein